MFTSAHLHVIYFLVVNGSDYRLLAMRSPHCTLHRLSRAPWSPSQEHIVILEAWVCLTEAQVSWSSSATSFQNSHDGWWPRSARENLPRSTATVSLHIPVFIYEGQEEQEGWAAVGAAVKRSDFSSLKDAHLRWAGVRVKYCWWEFSSSNKIMSSVFTWW